MSEIVKIEKEKLEMLARDAIQLAHLQGTGVDNWIGIEFVEPVKDSDVNDLMESLIK